MSTFIAQIDHFVRWFFNVSPTSTSIEPEPPRRRARTAARHPRPASSRERREPRGARKATVFQFDQKEGK